MNANDEFGRSNLSDDKLKEVAGGNSLLPPTGGGLIGFDPLKADIDVEIIPADPTHKFDPEIGMDVDPKGSKPTSYSLKRCPYCMHLLMPTVISIDDKKPTYCEFCGANLYAILFQNS